MSRYLKKSGHDLPSHLVKDAVEKSITGKNWTNLTFKDDSHPTGMPLAQETKVNKKVEQDVKRPSLTEPKVGYTRTITIKADRPMDYIVEALATSAEKVGCKYLLKNTEILDDGYKIQLDFMLTSDNCNAMMFKFMDKLVHDRCLVSRFSFHDIQATYHNMPSHVEEKTAKL